MHASLFWNINSRIYACRKRTPLPKLLLARLFYILLSSSAKYIRDSGVILPNIPSLRLYKTMSLASSYVRILSGLHRSALFCSSRGVALAVRNGKEWLCFVLHANSAGPVPSIQQSYVSSLNLIQFLMLLMQSLFS